MQCPFCHNGDGEITGAYWIRVRVEHRPYWLDVRCFSYLCSECETSWNDEPGDMDPLWGRELDWAKGRELGGGRLDREDGWD